MNKILINKFNLRKKRKGISLLVLVFSGFAILALAGFVIDLGMVLNSRYELQKIVETSALTAIADYEAYEDGGNIIRYPSTAQIATNVNSSVNNNLNAFIASNSFMYMSTAITPTVTFGTTIQSRYSRAIRIDATAVAKTHLLNLIGIRSIKLQSSVAAMHVPVYLKIGTILSGTGAYNDTDLRDAAGGASSVQTINGYNYAMPAITNINKTLSNIYGMPEGTVLSLGPGGYITIKPSAALVDGKGFDMQIITRGYANGYFVFAGNDHDPSNPYVDAASPGGGIDWVNISCTGTPVGTHTTGRVASYNQFIPFGIGNQAKIYGSAYFDLGAACSSGYNANVKSAKYLKIIDDNIEDGFILRDPDADSNLTAVPAFLPGQNSSLTPGVSIDSIAIEHHSRLISTADFAKDTDSDGLIDIFETSLGLGPCGPSDGTQDCSAPPAGDDAGEYWGYINSASSNVIIDNPSNALGIDYASHGENPPLMFINH